MSASLVLHLLRRVHPQEREAVFQQAARLVGQLEAGGQEGGLFALDAVPPDTENRAVEFCLPRRGLLV